MRTSKEKIRQIWREWAVARMVATMTPSAEAFTHEANVWRSMTEAARRAGVEFDTDYWRPRTRQIARWLGEEVPELPDIGSPHDD